MVLGSHVGSKRPTWFHLGLDDGDPIQARKILGPHLPIGITIHDDLARAQRYRHIIDYVGVGPVFPTSTKKDARSVLGIDKLTTIVEQSPVPVVAIGGIQLSNIESVLCANPQSIALCSALCQNPNPKKLASELLEITNRLES